MMKADADDRERVRRNAELAAIHIAKKRLRLDEDNYRSLLKRETGYESSADLNGKERARVLTVMKALLMPAPRRRGEGPAEPQLRLMRGLWCDLALYGVVRDSSERALTHFVRRITKVDALTWLTAADANRVLQALKAMKGRATERRPKGISRK